MVGYYFVSQEEAVRCGGEDPALRVDNPISEELSVLRHSVIPSLIEAAVANRARGLLALGPYETGPEFMSGEPGQQRQMAAALRMGDA